MILAILTALKKIFFLSNLTSDNDLKKHVFLLNVCKLLVTYWIILIILNLIVVTLPLKKGKVKYFHPTISALFYH